MVNTLASGTLQLYELANTAGKVAHSNCMLWVKPPRSTTPGGGDGGGSDSDGNGDSDGHAMLQLVAGGEGLQDLHHAARPRLRGWRTQGGGHDEVEGFCCGGSGDQ